MKENKIKKLKQILLRAFKKLLDNLQKKVKRIFFRELTQLLDNLQKKVKRILFREFTQLLDDLEKQLTSQLDYFSMYAQMEETHKVSYADLFINQTEIKLLIMDSQSRINSIRELTQIFFELELRDLEDEESNQMFLYRQLRESLSELEEELKKQFGDFYMYAKMEETDKVAYANLYLNETKLQSISMHIKLKIDFLRELTKKLLGVE